MSLDRAKSEGKKRKNRKTRAKPGTPPGTVAADPLALPTIIRVMAYDANRLIEKDTVAVDELQSYLDKWPTVWIDVTGLANADVIRAIGDLLKLHSLALEDVVNVHQRAKVDEFEDYLFVVARTIEDAETCVSEQNSFFLKRGVVVSFQERPGDCWEPTRIRMRNGRGRIRTVGPDYLLHALLDAIVDTYFPAIDKISEQVDALDDEIATKTHTSQIHQVHLLRGRLLSLRRAIRPHRDLFNELIRDEHPLITNETKVFLRDCYDHVYQVIELVDTYRDMTADLRDFYLSSASNRLNEIMKVLTIIATIFMPLSFIAGVYGMNFDTSQPLNMPELRWPLGYIYSLTLMGATAIGLIAYIRHRRWI